MALNEQQRINDISKLLFQLDESWSTEISGVSAPKVWTELLQAAKSTLAPHTRGESHEKGSRHDPDSRRLLDILCNLSRFALDPASSAKARTRKLTLDCLSAGVDLANGGSADMAGDALAQSATGARDERWGVRAAAASLAGTVVHSGGGSGGRGSDDGRLLNLLSSKDGLWLPALVADEYPEVQQCARAAVCGPAAATAPILLPSHSDSVAASLPAPCLWSTAALVATVRLAKNALLETISSSDNGGETTVGTVKSAITTRTALRALRGVCSLESRFPSFSPRKEPTAASPGVFVEGLEAIEAWLASTQEGPPSAPPWTIQPQSATSSDFPCDSLSIEARDTVRALASRIRERTRVEASAAAAIEAFREECCSRNAGGPTQDEGDAGSDYDDEWRRLYGGLLVRLEVLLFSADSPATDVKDLDSPGGKSEHDESKFIVNNGDFASLPIELVAETLEEVPFACERAVPTFYDDDKRPSSERKTMVQLGETRRRWIVSCAQLLLRAATRICGKRAGSTASVTALGSRGIEAVTRLMVTVLPFERGSLRADDPVEAWLLSVRSGGFQSSPVARGAFKSFQLTSDTLNIAPTDDPAMSSDTGSPSKIATPIPWQSCVYGLRHLQTHELPAPWAANPRTRQLASDIVDACWERLSLNTDSPLATQNTEALLRALRAKIRKSGWREGPGVGGKHAVAATIRRLKFPLLAGPALGHLLPLALPLADDHDVAHQAIGWSLLLHVEMECMPSELAWHRGLLLEVLEIGLRGGGGRDASSSLLLLAAAATLLRRSCSEKSEAVEESVARAGLRLAREALSQAGKTRDGEVRIVMVTGAAALLEVPTVAAGYALCEILRPALLCLLPILQSSAIYVKLDARAAALRAIHALCLSCWPRVRAHSAKLLCALLWTCGYCRRRQTEKDFSASKHGAYAFEKPSATLLSADEVVSEYATRMGAMILLLSGDTGRSTLKEVCVVLNTLRPVATAIEQLADSAGADASSEDMLETGGDTASNDGSDSARLSPLGHEADPCF